MPESLICTVPECGKPRANQDPSATNRHCLEHKRESQRSYLLTKEMQTKNREFLRGVEAMREYLAENFEGYNAMVQKFSGPEIGSIIRRVKGPMPAALQPDQVVAS